MAVTKDEVRRRGRLGYWTLVVFYLFFAVLTWLMDHFEVTLKMDRLIHDSWVRVSQSQPEPGIVIVGIDAASVGEHGRWPWSRNDQAKIIEQLTGGGARTILIDVLYTDYGVSNPEGDARLAYAIEKSGSVVLPILTEGRGSELQDGERLPITQIAIASSTLGHIFLPIDTDGIVRRVFLKAGFKTALVNAFTCLNGK